MAVSFMRFGRLTLVLAAVSALLPQGPWIKNAAAQTAELPARPVVNVTASELEEIKEELRYLRSRDAERRAWEEAVDGRLTKDRLIPAGSSESEQFNAEPQVCDGTHEDGCLRGHDSCACPLPEAPCLSPHVSTLNRYFNIELYGALYLDAIFNTARPVVPWTPFYLFPDLRLNQNTIDFNARQTRLGAALTGPDLGEFHTGALILGTLYGSNVFADQYGFLPLQAYVELKNDDWRFSTGLQFDVFAPLSPTMLVFSALAGSGNVGNTWRGSIRLERYLHPSDDVQWTIQGALSDPVTTVIDPSFTVTEDNGWPNVEGRLALGLGTPEQVGGAMLRPFEAGVSGIVGQVRQTSLAAGRVVTDVWGIATDLRWKVTSKIGIAGELYTGNALGNYNAAILQQLNPDTEQGIRSSGGWGEVFYYWTPCLHSHAGYALDRPVAGDISATPLAFGKTFNSTVYANLLWEVTQAVRIGIEATWRETDYKAAGLPDNQGFGFHTQFRWTF